LICPAVDFRAAHSDADDNLADGLKEVKIVVCVAGNVVRPGNRVVAEIPVRKDVLDLKILDSER
jgi:hypothetical protein